MHASGRRLTVAWKKNDSHGVFYSPAAAAATVAADADRDADQCTCQRQACGDCEDSNCLIALAPSGVSRCPSSVVTNNKSRMPTTFSWLSPVVKESFARKQGGDEDGSRSRPGRAGREEGGREKLGSQIGGRQAAQYPVLSPGAAVTNYAVITSHPSLLPICPSRWPTGWWCQLGDAQSPAAASSLASLLLPTWSSGLARHESWRRWQQHMSRTVPQLMVTCVVQSLA